MASRAVIAVLVVSLAIAARCAAAAEMVDLADRPPPKTADIVVYGGTAGGIAAAIQAARMGKTVLLVEPGRHLGGLTSGGLGATDIGNKQAIGGVAREFYRRLGKHYEQPSAWTFQPPDAFLKRRQPTKELEMWTFEPHVAEMILRDWLREANVSVILGERLDLKQGVSKQDGRIVSITMESGLTCDARMFIDATYEGDLLAGAGVSHHIGREANATYRETYNGVQTQQATKHQFMVPVDPFRMPGNPQSGLLPGIQEEGPGEEGAGDKRVQAYNFRMCLTDVAENRIPFPKPAGYDPLRYELLARYIQGGVWDAFCSNLPMPNHKTDTNNCGGFSTDNIGMNYAWPEGDHATRERLFTEHVTYQQGLMWFLANDPRVPEKIRTQISQWGLCKDEFTDNGGWPHQLYVREARRMVSDHVMTQHNCQGRATVDDPVGLAAYSMDSHNVQRYARDGRVYNEGDVQIHGITPYPIAYRSIRPRESECKNLLVPVCLSASHIAYGSIRMEPVFMVLGQSAATAAVHALDEGVSVQQIDPAKLQKRLLADQQVLAWTGAPLGRDPKKLPGVVVDDTAAKTTGDWSHSSSIPGFVGVSYLHDGNANKGSCRAVFSATLPKPGRYEVRVACTPNANRATNVPVTIATAAGDKTLTLNQQKAVKDGFATLGMFDLGTMPTVTITNAGTNGHVIVDAVQFVVAE